MTLHTTLRYLKKALGRQTIISQAVTWKHLNDLAWNALGRDVDAISTQWSVVHGEPPEMTACKDKTNAEEVADILTQNGHEPAIFRRHTITSTWMKFPHRQEKI